MYHFFAKNEELKSKTSILEARLVSVEAPNNTSCVVNLYWLIPFIFKF
jgi:hypothetical protein